MGWEESSRLEHAVSSIITQQELNGWKFDLNKANSHVRFLNEERNRLYSELRKDLGYDRYIGTGTVEKPFTKAGTHSVRVQKYWGEDSFQMVCGPYTPLWYEEPDLASRKKLQVHLERLGWKPIYYTDKGNPQIEEESLSLLQGEIGQNLARWFVLSHRQHQIEGWIKNVRDDGRITAGANPCGTPTGRMRHNIVVNVPKTNHKKEDGSPLYYPQGSVIFGTEMRELFICEDGYSLIGYDAKGLELRMLAHYMNDPLFTEAVVSGDPHSYNQRQAGIDSRDVIKTLIYALIYGASDRKLGTIVNGTVKDGRELRERLLKGLPRLRQLIERVQRAATRGYLLGLDGRKMPVRAEHAALNTLLQGGGAICMKTVMVYVQMLLDHYKYDLDIVRKVGDQHDESQQEVKNGYEERYGRIVEYAFDLTTQHYNLNCPIHCDIKQGLNWSMTH